MSAPTLAIVRRARRWHHGPVPDPSAQTQVERELGWLVRRYRVAMVRAAEAVHPDLDVAGYTLLLAVVDAGQDRGGGVVRVAAIEERLRVHKSTLSRGLAALEGLGLVERLPDPVDARARLVRLTGDGRGRLERVRSERRAVLARALDGWAPADLGALGEALRRLNVDLDAAAGNED